MKVLLLGEFSSLHKFLKDGLQELGVETTIAANGDGWKKIGGADIALPEYEAGGPVKRARSYLRFLNAIRQLKGYDVVQIINPNIFSFAIWKASIRWLKKQNTILSLVSAGDQYILLDQYKRGTFDYYAYDYDKKIFETYSSKTIAGRMRIKRDLSISKSADIVIPCAYEYSLGYGKKISKVIPLPINVQAVNYAENTVREKIVIFHGINRELAKGTPFIREAMERIKKDFPDKVEIIIDGRMPFEKYLEVMSRTNIVIDQCLAYGYGINACLAMAQGKVVLAPCRKETLNAVGLKTSPIISIEPNADIIYQKLVMLVKHKDEISQIGAQSMKYVCDYHDCVKIAGQYIQAWKSTGKV